MSQRQEIDPDAFDLGHNLATLRQQAGLKQKEVAKYIGVSPGSVSNWESNTQAPKLVQLKKLALLYKTTTDHILGLAPQMPFSLEGFNETTQAAIIQFLNKLKAEIGE